MRGGVRRMRKREIEKRQGGKNEDERDDEGKRE